MKIKQLYNLRKNYFNTKIEYRCCRYTEFDYSILNQIMYIKKPGKKSDTISDCIMMLDTETSKTKAGEVCENYVVAWTISIRAFHVNVCTLYGNKPSECVECITMLLDAIPGVIHYLYVYNLSYDWVFLRKFLMQEYGEPEKQLNTKSHYPIYIKFGNGLILRDALCLAQRKLEKWSKDMNVEHQKAVGFWDYDLIRDQDHVFTPEEITYIENDTLAGVECIDALLQSIGKRIYSIPWTATGIPRDEVKSRGKQFNGHDSFSRQALDYYQQEMIQNVFHGGYTHGNRLYYNEKVTGLIDCYDFASSYPFVMLTEKYPCERFTLMDDCSAYDIMNDTENAYFFKLIMIDVSLKDRFFPMPALQFSKCVKTINADVDNGRITCCDYAEIYLTEIDLKVIFDQYDIGKHICVSVYSAYKDYLPRWFTDYIYQLFEDKTMLKGVDPVLYGVAKGKLNSLYGMTVQRPVPNTLIEDYETGDYIPETVDKKEVYEQFLKKKNNVLNYQIGVWVTAYAFHNLFILGSCAGTWLYSDTDSCYGIDWDLDQIEQYNNKCKQKLLSNGYGPVIRSDREYWLGVAEHDGRYTEFKVIGAKRYCGRSIDDGQLHITVAGVPKNGSKVLNDNIDNFRPGCIFPGSVTGKKTHTYFYADDIHTDDKGNEIGDSIDLSPCDYLLSAVFDWDGLHKEEIEVNFYE